MPTYYGMPNTSDLIQRDYLERPGPKYINPVQVGPADPNAVRELKQYGSEQYGLYSGYIKPGVAFLKQKRGQLPQNYQRITPEFVQENIMPYMSGGITRAQQVGKAVQALSDLGIKGSRRFKDIESAYRKAASFYHPDKWVGASPAQQKLVGTHMQVLSRSIDILRKNKDILREYGIF